MINRILIGTGKQNETNKPIGHKFKRRVFAMQIAYCEAFLVVIVLFKSVIKNRIYLSLFTQLSMRRKKKRRYVV